MTEDQLNKASNMMHKIVTLRKLIKDLQVLLPVVEGGDSITLNGLFIPHPLSQNLVQRALDLAVIKLTSVETQFGEL